MKFIYLFFRILFFYFLFVIVFRLVVFLFKSFFNNRRKSTHYQNKRDSSTKDGFSKRESIIDAEYEEIE